MAYIFNIISFMVAWICQWSHTGRIFTPASDFSGRSYIDTDHTGTASALEPSLM
jgi:hypothetical protein